MRSGLGAQCEVVTTSSESFMEKVQHLADPFRTEAKLPEQTAVFIGRYQPFHNGHLQVVKNLAAVFDHVVVVIGSANKSYTEANPFTAGERYEMVRKSVWHVDEPLLNVDIIPINDTDNNSSWLANLREYCPPFNIVVGNNVGVLAHFQNTHYKTMRPEHFRRDILVGTLIRRAMVEGDVETVQERVPEGTWKVIERVRGIERIQALITKD